MAKKQTTENVETTEQQVTDAELAELEADNAAETGEVSDEELEALEPETNEEAVVEEPESAGEETPDEATLQEADSELETESAKHEVYAEQDTSPDVDTDAEAQNDGEVEHKAAESESAPAADSDETTSRSTRSRVQDRTARMALWVSPASVPGSMTRPLLHRPDRLRQWAPSSPTGVAADEARKPHRAP